jgi:YesN/AraC family two-component response regulator
VVSARNGPEAIATFRIHHGEIDAVILDLTMPLMRGDELFQELRGIDPGVQVILSSGYSERSAMKLASTRGLAGFLHKPYRSEQLFEKLREILTRS